MYSLRPSIPVLQAEAARVTPTDAWGKQVPADTQQSHITISIERPRQAIDGLTSDLQEVHYTCKSIHSKLGPFNPDCLCS